MDRSLWSPALPRRRLLAGAAASCALVGLGAAPSVAQDAMAPVTFRVNRHGSPIGTHAVRFREEAGDLIVETAIDLEISIAFITIFTFTHRNTERWRDGRLVALDSTTHDTGEDYWVTARATEQGVAVEGSRGQFLGPHDILTTSLWNREITGRDRAIDTQKGRIFEFAVTEGPSEFIRGDGGRLPARRYSFRGDLNIDVWYDLDDQVAAVAFETKGSPITYERLRRDAG